MANETPKTVAPCAAAYRAEHVPGAVILHASGIHDTSGYQVFFEQLPLRVFPPQFSLWHVKPAGAALPVITPFAVVTSFEASGSIESVVVHDAAGRQEIRVEPIPDPLLEHAGAGGRSDACSDWAAWHDRMPGGRPTLHVTGECAFPTGGYTVELRRKEPQGINPADLLLDKIVREPAVPAPDVAATVKVRYTEETDTRYDTVTILPDGATVPVTVAV